MSKKTIFKQLNTLRKFDSDHQIKEYFTFYNTDPDYVQASTYTMNDAQMTEWENAQLRKNFNRVIHHMRSVHKTIGPHKGKWK